MLISYSVKWNFIVCDGDALGYLNTDDEGVRMCICQVGDLGVEAVLGMEYEVIYATCIVAASRE